MGWCARVQHFSTSLLDDFSITKDPVTFDVVYVQTDNNISAFAQVDELQVWINNENVALRDIDGAGGDAILIDTHPAYGSYDNNPIDGYAVTNYDKVNNNKKVDYSNSGPHSREILGIKLSKAYKINDLQAIVWYGRQGTNGGPRNQACNIKVGKETSSTLHNNYNVLTAINASKS